ncbi:MAG: hypothetical protein AAF716_09325 [Cyanobacteria bacterium P01_D01_bin.1]
MPGLRDRTPPKHTSPRLLQSDFLLVSVSVGVGTAAALATTAIHVAQRHTDQHAVSNDAPTAQVPLPTRATVQTSAASAAQIAPQPTDTISVLPLLSQKSAFEKALAFGWQAALKGQRKDQNSQHTAAQWGEAALLWQQAIYLLEQIPPADPSYSAAREKQAVYESNLQQIMTRQLAALIAEASLRPLASAAVKEDWIAIAKKQGWQAALAGQNAPHPTEKWAQVSRLWQAALQTLENIEPQSPEYAEATTIKAQYQKNLAAIRKRYQIEQSTDQTLRSLQATLREIESSSPIVATNKRAQLVAIIERLQTIPLGTMAHARAQNLIESTTAKLSELPIEPTPRLATTSQIDSEADTQ